MVLPDGPRDIEAMYVLPTDQIFFVTKGRNHPVTIYRYPSPLRSEGVGFGANGAIVLNSESVGGPRPSFTFLTCSLN